MKAILKITSIYFVTTLLAGIFAVTHAQSKPDSALPTEKDYYRIITLPVPESIELEVGGLAVLPNGNLAAATRRGDVWIIENPYMLNGSNPYYRKFASGLHEVLGLAYKDGALYMAQRGELTKLIDKNGDGKADVYETVYEWPLTGGYHEYSYGPIILPNGNFMVTTNVMFDNLEWWRGKSHVPWRGWTLEITPDGKMMPYATGMRSPAGLGLVDGQFFFADNQGDWEASGGLVQLSKGDFTGNPAGLAWAGEPQSPVKVTLRDIYSRIDPRFGTGSKIEDDDSARPYKTLFEVAKEVPGVKLPAVWLPHNIMGNSTSELLQIPQDSTFGPFGGQVLVGDQTQSRINRVFLEKVKGEYQGAAFPFREGFESGVLRLAWGNDGSLFVGQTNRGWGSRGPKDFGLERVVWSGKTPFEMKAIRAMPDGFEIEFTQPVNKKAAGDPDAYSVIGFIYKYHPVYGSNIVREKTHFVNAAIVSNDGMRVRLVVDSLREKYINEIKVDNSVISEEKKPLLHPVAYYTLNNIPEGDRLNLPRRKIIVKTTTAVKESTATTKAALKKNQTTKPPGWTTIDQRILIGTKPGLKYDKTELTVKAGSRVMVTFSNNDDMAHNFVIVQPGQGNAVGEMALKMGLEGVKKGHIPNTPKLLYNTTLVGPGSKQTIYFIAPDKPGKYTYVCTVPGHYLLMQGTLVVTK